MVCHGPEKPLILLSKASYFTSGYVQLMGIIQLESCVKFLSGWEIKLNQRHHGCQRAVQQKSCRVN